MKPPQKIPPLLPVYVSRERRRQLMTFVGHNLWDEIFPPLSVYVSWHRRRRQKMMVMMVKWWQPVSQALLGWHRDCKLIYLLADNIKSSYERAATALTSIILWAANFQMTNVSLRIFRLQKKKFTARTFDSDTSWTQFRARVTERWSQTLQSRCREERGIWVRWGSPATDPPCYQSKMFTLSEQQQLRAEIPGGWTGPQASRDRGQTSHLPTTLRRKSVFRIMPTLTWTL